jgi:hypothetical protein
MKHSLFLLAGLGLLAPSWSQSACNSDGQARATALVERFISADCAQCWSAGETDAGAAGALVLDWIVPSTQGDEAPLSAAANPEALARLQALGQPAPAQTLSMRQPLAAGVRPALRLAQGPAVADYLGTMIEVGPARAASPWTVSLALVEAIPAGAEGAAIPRNLVRHLLQVSWNMGSTLSKAKQRSFAEMRSMRIPDGAAPGRLRLIGWVQDAKGRMLAAAQTVCAASE